MLATPPHVCAAFLSGRWPHKHGLRWVGWVVRPCGHVAHHGYTWQCSLTQLTPLTPELEWSECDLGVGGSAMAKPPSVGG